MKRPLFSKAIFFTLILTFFISAQQTPVQLNGRLSVQGNKVLNSSGEPVQLMGMSLFWSQWGNKYWNSNVVTWLADDWKVSLVRAAMGIETLDPNSKGYLDDSNRHKEYVKTVVNAAIAKGIYVIIDWHDHNAHNHVNQAKAFFQEMANTYKEYPNIIYEVFNEPENISWSGVVKPYAQTIIDAIRAIDPNNLIIVGTPKWCQDVDVAANDPIDASNIVYAFHFYAASHKGTYRAKVQSALNKQVAVFVSEMGTCEYTGNGSVDIAESTTWLSFLEQNKISWANWAINDKGESASALVSKASTTGGWSESALTQSGKYIREKLRAYAASGPSPTTYTLGTSVTGQGSITRSPQAPSYSSGTKVTLTATAAKGWAFSGWSSDASGTTNPLYITMNGNKNITALFTEEQVRVNDKNEFTLQCPAVNFATVRLYDLTGRLSGLIHRGSIQSGSITLTGIPKGIYVLIITDSSAKELFKTKLSLIH